MHVPLALSCSKVTPHLSAVSLQASTVVHAKSKERDISVPDLSRPGPGKNVLLLVAGIPNRQRFLRTNS